MVATMSEGVAVTNGRPKGDGNRHVGGGAYGYPYAPTLSGSPISLGAGGGGGGGGGGIGGVSLHGFLLWMNYHRLTQYRSQQTANLRCQARVAFFSYNYSISI